MKRVFKFLGIFMISAVFLFYAGIGIFHLSEYSIGNKYVGYLKEHKFELDINQNFSFDSSFYNYQLFMVGEMHGVAKSPEIDYQLFKHLHQKAYVRYYMAEVDYSQAYFLNKYLRTGNDSLLSYSLKKFIPIQARDNKDYYDKWRSLYAYNKRLSENNKIYVLGCDYTTDYDLVLAHLKEITNNTSLQESVGFRKNSLEDLMLYANTILNDEKLLERASNALRDSYYDYVHILKNLQMAKNMDREGKTFRNFKEIYEHLNLENEKIYAYYGFAHVLQAPLKNGGKPLAYLIKESGLSIGNNMVSIAMTYIDSKMIMPSDMIPDFLRTGKIWSELDYSCESILLYYRHGIKDLKRTSSPNTTTVYRLDGKGSPYFNSDRLHNFSMILPFLRDQKIDISPDHVTADYNQYFILVRNSEAARPNNL